MLAEVFTQDTPLPQPGSIGYLRGTAQRARVLRRDPGNPNDPDGDPRCLVQLYRRHLATWEWEPVPGSTGNRWVLESDLYHTERQAMFCGRPPRPSRSNSRRRGGRA